MMAKRKVRNRTPCTSKNLACCHAIQTDECNKCYSVTFAHWLLTLSSLCCSHVRKMTAPFVMSFGFR